MVRAGSRGKSVSTSIRVEYDAVARPEDFSNLKVGEGIYMGPSGVMKIKVPLVKLGRATGEIDFPRFRMPPAPGLAVAEKYHMFSATGA